MQTRETMLLGLEWQSMDNAPTDGTWIQARIPGHGSDNVIAWIDGLLDSNDNDCGGWTFMTEQEPPDCWTDGICWDVNEDGAKSTQPTEWKHLPPEQRTRPGYVNHQDGDA